LEQQLLFSRKRISGLGVFSMPSESTFNKGDRIHIHRRFVRFFPSDSGVIVAAQTDPLRPLVFSEYTIEFNNGTKANLFAFQIYQNGYQGNSQ